MKEEKKMTVREMIEARFNNCTRMNEIADAAEARESKELTDAEKAEVQKLERENRIYDLQIAGSGVAPVASPVSREAGFQNWIRERAKEHDMQGYALKRESIMVSTNAAPMIPLAINDIIKPLEEGLILGKVGLKVQTGLSGNYVWPTVAAIEGEWAGESAALTDKTIAIDKIVPTPYRLGATVSVTSQLINQTDGVAYAVVKEQIPMAITRTLNKTMFSPVTVNANKVNGPFVNCKKAAAKAIGALTTTALRKEALHITFAGELPTYKELLAMKGIILAKGIISDGTFCYVMDEYTKAMLESTPRDAGSGLMIIENDKIAGVPVFCTNYINNDGGIYVGLGVWSYQALGQFGEQRFIVDPYTKASKDTTVLTLNGDWSMTTLRQEAFLLGDCMAAGVGG